MLRYLDPVYGNDITDDVSLVIDHLHSSQILREDDLSGRFEVYRVMYTYRTKRGNQRQHEKYILLSGRDCENGCLRARRFFLQWCSKFNNSNPYRRIKVSSLNVEDFAYGQVS